MVNINAGNISKGIFLIYKGVPHQVVKTEFMSPGKGSPVMRVKFKNAQTGAASEYTYKSAENVEVADVEKKEMQFLYRDGNDLVFMNPQNYDQASVPVALITEKVGFLTPNLKCYVTWYKENAIGVDLPPNVVLVVTEAPDAIAGNRINSPKKPVKVETGIEVQAPIFVKVGDKISVDTSTGEYLSRIK